MQLDEMFDLEGHLLRVISSQRLSNHTGPLGGQHTIEGQ